MARCKDLCRLKMSSSWVPSSPPTNRLFPWCISRVVWLSHLLSLYYVAGTFGHVHFFKRLPLMFSNALTEGFNFFFFKMCWTYKPWIVGLWLYMQWSSYVLFAIASYGLLLSPFIVICLDLSLIPLMLPGNLYTHYLYPPVSDHYGDV